MARVRTDQKGIFVSEEWRYKSFMLRPGHVYWVRWGNELSGGVATLEYVGADPRNPERARFMTMGGGHRNLALDNIVSANEHLDWSNRG